RAVTRVIYPTSGTAGAEKANIVLIAASRGPSHGNPSWMRTCERPMAHRKEGASNGIANKASKMRRPGNWYSPDKRPTGNPATSEITVTATATTRLRHIARPDRPARGEEA